MKNKTAQEIYTQFCNKLNQEFLKPEMKEKNLELRTIMLILKEICLSQEPEEAPVGESAAYWKAKFDEVHNILFPEDDATVTEVIDVVKRFDDDIDKYHKQAIDYHELYEKVKSEKEQLEYKYEHHEKGELAVKLQLAEKNNEVQEAVIENLQERLSKYESSIQPSKVEEAVADGYVMVRESDNHILSETLRLETGGMKVRGAYEECYMAASNVLGLQSRAQIHVKNAGYKIRPVRLVFTDLKPLEGK